MKPIDGSRIVREGRDAYLAANGWRVEDYDAKHTEASFLGLDIKVPNTPRHRDAIRVHDLHHVATGFGTDVVGEAEISAWELRGGLRGLDLYVGSIVISGALLGLLCAPRRTLRAFRAARGARNLFASKPSDYETLLDLRVADLRARLGVPSSGIAGPPARLHARAPRVSDDATTPASARLV